MSGKGKNEQVTAVSTADWLKRKANQVVEDTLPSGLQVRLKKHVSLESLAMAGHIPLTLMMELAKDAEAVEGTAASDEAAWGDMLKQLDSNLDVYMSTVDGVFRAAMVSPKIGDSTDIERDILSIHEFEDEPADKIYVFQKVTGASDALSPFRTSESGNSGNSTQSRKRVRKPAKSPA